MLLAIGFERRNGTIERATRLRPVEADNTRIDGQRRRDSIQRFGANTHRCGFTAQACEIALKAALLGGRDRFGWRCNRLSHARLGAYQPREKAQS